MCSLNTAAECCYSALYPFSTPQHGHIASLITGNILTFRFNFRVSETCLRGHDKFLMRLAIANVPPPPLFRLGTVHAYCLDGVICIHVQLCNCKMLYNICMLKRSNSDSSSRDCTRLSSDLERCVWPIQLRLSSLCFQSNLLLD